MMFKALMAGIAAGVGTFAGLVLFFDRWAKIDLDNFLEEVFDTDDQSEIM